MKKSVFLLGLLAIAGITLTACGSKNYEMSFDEALEIANHSAFQDILAENDNFEQDFNLAGSFDKDGTKIEANISSNSKQSLDNKAESSVKFDANITSEGETMKANGALDVKVVEDGIYLNLSEFDLTGSQDLSFVAMMAEGFKNQWFSIPMSGLSDIPNTFSILKNSNELNAKVKEIINNEGSAVYSGKFTQFNGYNAWKISLNTEKLNALIEEYYSAMSNNLNGEAEDLPELNIENFEGYLVITGKDKVTTVIENMEMPEDDMIVTVNGYAGEDYELNVIAGEEPAISIVAKKKGGKYNVDATVADTLSLNGTISPKLSKSSIDLKFDAKITVKDEGEETVVPFKGSWKYNSISEFSVTAPEEAQDLSELFGSYLGGIMGGDDYYDDYDYEDYDYENYDDEYLEDEANVEEAAEEALAE